MDEHDRGDYDPMLNAQPPEPAAPGPAADDYADASRQAGNYASQMAPAHHEPIADEADGHRNLIISLCALVGLALIAAGIYWFTLRNKPAEVPATAQKTTQSATTTPAKTTSIDSATKDYTSPNFNLALSYPADWTVTDSGGGSMTVKSPQLNLTAGDGTSQKGIIVLTVRDHAQKLTEFNAGNATATRNSLKVAYSKPTQTQRANTYLSFLQYAQTTTSGALDGVYITGDNGYQKGQAIPGTDVAKADPIISITFTDTSGKGLNITDKSWDDTSLSGPLTKLLESFSIN